MILTNRREILKDEYRCDLTRELDKLAGLDKSDHYYFFYHYVVYDNIEKKYSTMALRVPGGTVGCIRLDENLCITKISIDKDYVVSTYPDDLDEKIAHFIGEKIEFEEESHD